MEIIDSYDFESMRKHLLAIREIRELLITGNYYQLTKDTEDLSQFCAMQAHVTSQDTGFVLVFRRPETEDEEFITLLQ